MLRFLNFARQASPDKSKKLTHRRGGMKNTGILFSLRIIQHHGIITITNPLYSIYLLKNRGGKTGLPVRVEPDDPEAIPIAIQNIKRTLSTTPDKFNNDILTANSRLEEGRLDLPPDEFVVDLYALGLEEAMVLTDENKKLTAQQTWPFVAAAYSTNGFPRPCWFIVRACDDIDQLIAYMKRAGKYGNGYLKRRLPDVLSSLQVVKDKTTIRFSSSKDAIFNEIAPYRDRCNSMSEVKKHPFSPEFLHKYPIDDNMKTIIHEFVSGNKNAGSALAAIMEMDSLTDNDKKYALALLPLCFESSSSNGLVSVLRTEHMKGYVSTARKMMFFADFFGKWPNSKLILTYGFLGIFPTQEDLLCLTRSLPKRQRLTSRSLWK